jgi:UrcA family protein
MLSIKSFVLLTATAAASFGAVGTVCAAEAQLAPSKMAVHFNREDLRTEEGIQKVYQQIRTAADNVCPSVGTGTLLLTQEAMACRKSAIANAVTAINNKRLAEVASAAKFG